LENTSRVVVDDYEGAFQAVSHLIAQGYRRIAHFHGPTVATTSRKRLDGYLDALRKHQLPIEDILLYPCQDITLEEGRAHVQQLLAQDPACDAIFSVTDSVAIGALTELKAQGISVPTQMGIVGFSDWQMASVMEPPLSSVAQPGQEMGRIATKMLIREIHANRDETPFQTESMTLPTRLCIRTSSNRGLVEPR
jgi:LacI family transcriptional regulator